jgi:hypothetical protein
MNNSSLRFMSLLMLSLGLPVQAQTSSSESRPLDGAGAGRDSQRNDARPAQEVAAKPLTPEQLAEQERLRREEILMLMCKKSFSGTCEFQGKR